MVVQGIVEDGEEFLARTGGQVWRMSWHPPTIAPAGTRHGSNGVCVTGDGEIVLISPDGALWDLPGGRPEGDESWEETLRREMMEEACARVGEARLLGFCRSICVEGREAGLVLVRSFWRAEVVLDEWEPMFEIAHRRVVPPLEVLTYLPTVFLPIFRRALREASVL